MKNEYVGGCNTIVLVRLQNDLSAATRGTNCVVHIALNPFLVHLSAITLALYLLTFARLYY